MQGLPKDDRGFPIPVIIFRDPAGKPLFTANDTRVVNHCAANDLCGICGSKLGDDSRVLGGPLSALHERGVYIDSPLHHECGQYALQVCPYLVLSAYKSKQDMALRLNDKYGGTTLFANPTLDPNRPLFFVFARISGFSRTSNGYIKPFKPFLDVEFWASSERISAIQARELVGPDQALLRQVMDEWVASHV